MSLSISTSSNDTSITASVSTSGSVSMLHIWYLNGVEKGRRETAEGVKGSSFPFTGLTPGTYYNISVSVYAYNPWRLLDSGSTTAKTTGTAPFVEPTIDINSCTSTDSTVTVNTRINAPSAGTYYVRFEAYYNSTSQKHDSYSFTSSTTLTYDFKNIPHSTSVQIYVYVLDANTNTQYDMASYRIDTTAPIRPSNWSWTSTVVKGATISHTKNNNIITCTPLTAKEWNGFIDRIFAFLVYMEVNVSSTASNFYVTSGNRMKASEVENARDLIALMNPSTRLPASITASDGITAAYINGLKDSLNSISRT